MEISADAMEQFGLPGRGLRVCGINRAMNISEFGAGAALSGGAHYLRER